MSSQPRLALMFSEGGSAPKSQVSGPQRVGPDEIFSKLVHIRGWYVRMLPHTLLLAFFSSGLLSNRKGVATSYLIPSPDEQV